MATQKELELGIPSCTVHGYLMLLDLGLLLVGGLFLYYGAEWFVRGAAGLAVKLGVRPLLIGLTIVSYATSAPELAVSMLAAAEGKSPIALGNVVGSNIANIGLILGITALIAPPKTDGSLISKEIVILLIATAALPAFLLDGGLSRLEALLFFAGALLFTVLVLRWSKQRPVELDDVPSEVKESKPSLTGLILLGLAVLLGGGKLFVDGAVGVAQTLGMSDRMIGLTVVAFGTSVPELAASLVAALRGHSEIAIGNVIGSNIFNLLLILGATGMVFPIVGSAQDMAVDLATMGGLTVLLAVVLRTERNIQRWEGAVMLATYTVFVVWIVLQRS